MKKLILAIYLFSLAGLVTSSCDCCDQCGTQEEQQEESAYDSEEFGLYKKYLDK